MASHQLPPRVDLDLDALRPEPRTFRYGGTVYRLPAEPPLPLIARAQQLRERLRSIQEDMDAAIVLVRPEGGGEAPQEDVLKAADVIADAERRQAETYEAMYQETMAVLRSENGDLADLPLTLRECMMIFGLAANGHRPDPEKPVELEEAIADAIVSPDAIEDAREAVASGDAVPPQRAARASARRSPGRSSS